MAEAVFTRELYPPNQFLNPSRSKISHKFLRKSKIASNSNVHNRALSLDHTSPHNGCSCAADRECTQQLRQMLANNTVLLKQIKQLLAIQAARTVVGLKPSHLQLLQQKTTLLEHQIKSKDQRMDSLRYKYDQLLNKFQNFTAHSKHASINTSFQTNTNRSLSPSRNNDFLNELKRLKERLKNIDFSGVLRVIDRVGHHINF